MAISGNTKATPDHRDFLSTGRMVRPSFLSREAIGLSGKITLTLDRQNESVLIAALDP